jgi:hypothetical protein
VYMRDICFDAPRCGPDSSATRTLPLDLTRTVTTVPEGRLRSRTFFDFPAGSVIERLASPAARLSAAGPHSAISATAKAAEARQRDPGIGWHMRALWGEGLDRSQESRLRGGR